jgi:hypothetical protein
MAQPHGSEIARTCPLEAPHPPAGLGEVLAPNSGWLHPCKTRNTEHFLAKKTVSTNFSPEIGGNVNLA